jgi:cytosine/adenosine deaminase-related metal-dependent hydrolase
MDYSNPILACQTPSYGLEPGRLNSMNARLSHNPRRLRAAWVLPNSDPASAIPDGEIVISNGKIEYVGPQRPAGSDPVIDFQEAAILPGLVNVHTHLDYTLMRGLIEDVEFFPWIRELNARKSALTMEDWEASAICGAAEAAASGITTIGDCCDSGAAMTGAKTIGLRGTIYQEVFGIDESRSVETILQELKQKVDNLKQAAVGTRLQAGISPHAPYTVRPELMRALARYAREENLRVCIHASESQAEVELLRSGTGPFADMFVRRGIVWNIPRKGTADYLHSLEILGPNTLLVHGVQLAAEEREALRGSGTAWAHCPKSNAKLGNGVAYLPMLTLENTHTDRQPAVGLGSDSVASNNGMDLFEEMRFAVLMQRAARRKIGALGASEAFEMATMGGARALGLDTEIGSLEAGKCADLCVFKLDELHSAPTYSPLNAIVYAGRASDVVHTYIDGELHYCADAPLSERFPGRNVEAAREKMRNAAHTMRQWRPDNT